MRGGLAPVLAPAMTRWPCVWWQPPSVSSPLLLRWKKLALFRRDFLVVRVVAATGVPSTRLFQAQALFLVTLDFEVTEVELLQERRGAVDADAPGVLDPVPHGIAAIVVNDAAGAMIRLAR